jgi:branched-chain amino acid transport system substrate-binding protein
MDRRASGLRKFWASQRIIGIASMVSLTVIATACSSSSSGGAGNKSKSGDFVIGAVNSLTGNYASVGKNLDAGLKVGVDEVNAKGGINGRTVVLKSVDDAGDSAKTQLAVKQLVEQDHVDMLIPNALSFLRQVTLPYETTKKVFTITSSATAALADPKKYPYSFLNGEYSLSRAPAMAQAIKDLGAVSKVGILHSNTNAQTDEAAKLSDIAPNFGLKVVKNTEIQGGATDVTSELAGLRSAGADVVVESAQYGTAINVVMSGMQTIGWKAPVFIVPEALVGNLADQKIPSAVSSQFHAVWYASMTKSATSPSAEMQAFISAASTHGPITYLAAMCLAHDEIWLTKWVYEQAQKESGNTSGDSLKKAAEEVGAQQDFPSQLMFAPNPGWSPDEHSTIGYDYSKFYSAITNTPAVNGIYDGTPLTIASH